MTNYVPCYASDFSRRELLTLADALNTDVRQAVCAWLQLNLWMQDNAPSGSIKDISAGTVAVGAGLPATQGVRLLDALAIAGLVDEHGQLTDWKLYGGRLLDSREKKAESMRKHRSRPPSPGGGVATTRRPPRDHTATTPTPPFAKEKLSESLTEIQNGAGGAESHAYTHGEYEWVNALVPGAITAAAEATQFQAIFDSRPDIDHTYELRTMFLKMGHPSRRRSWAQQYASWIRDGQSHKLLPAHQPEPPAPRTLTPDEFARIKRDGPADDDEYHAAIWYQTRHRADS